MMKTQLVIRMLVRAFKNLLFWTQLSYFMLVLFTLLRKIVRELKLHFGHGFQLTLRHMSDEI